ncbi:hypothetical protein [Ensifer sp. SL37]|uniref:hypothetical protein n=1 Tax=Ensifer sp. SL37 TaxID=2995137 RepID=UPI000B304892|nr:hypothetical protein [Ensifer sp. SL37]MCY1742820.1 hypothetical protein [Ensifer sp. SL37]
MKRRGQQTRLLRRLPPDFGAFVGRCALCAAEDAVAATKNPLRAVSREGETSNQTVGRLKLQPTAGCLSP